MYLAELSETSPVQCAFYKNGEPALKVACNKLLIKLFQIVRKGRGISVAGRVEKWYNQNILQWKQTISRIMGNQDTGRFSS